MSDFSELVHKRQSCRRFQHDRPVPREELDACLELARLAPSACNSQPWRFTVVDSSEGRAAMLPCVQKLGMNKFSSFCSAFVIVTETPAALLPKFAGLLQDQQFAQIDVGIAVAHFTLAAAERGLATCIMGWFDENGVRAAFAIPKNSRVRLVIGVGYAQEDDPLREKARRPLDEVRVFAPDIPKR